MPTRQALVGLKQPQRAIQQLRLAVQESPEFVDAWFELARLLEADRQYSEANEIYNSLIEQQTRTIRTSGSGWSKADPRRKGQKALDYALNGPATYGYKLTAATLFLDARMYPRRRPCSTASRAIPMRRTRCTSTSPPSPTNTTRTCRKP